jgi:hypothetical protein
MLCWLRRGESIWHPYVTRQLDLVCLPLDGVSLCNLRAFSRVEPFSLLSERRRLIKDLLKSRSPKSMEETAPRFSQLLYKVQVIFSKQKFIHVFKEIVLILLAHFLYQLSGITFS